MRTSNPALTEKAFSGLRASADDRMSIEGTVNKSLLLGFILIICAIWSWYTIFPGGVTQRVEDGWTQPLRPQIPVWFFILMGGTFITPLVIIFKKPWAPMLAPVYAAGEGVLLGTISSLFEFRYPGIVFQAVLATVGTFMALLLAYKSRLIQVTENFKLGIVAATGGICIVYLVDMVMRFWGPGISFLHDSSALSIGISVVIVAVAALNLVLDFDLIENASKQGAPKYMEWYSAFALLVTLVWLYLEILKLLSKARSRK